MKKSTPRLWPPLYGLCLVAFTIYILLDAFVIPRSYASVVSNTAQSLTASSGSTASVQQQDSAEDSATATDSSYSSGGVSIQLKQYRQDNTDLYVADITLSDASSFKTALAENTYGKNITQTTSQMASDNGAILAINGDYYSARSGYMIRNGVLYRDTSGDASQQDLVIYKDGTFGVIAEGDISAQQLLENGAQQVFSFGPALVQDGKVAVSENAEVAQAKSSNPRTVIGIVDELHYVMVVADGRTEQSSGLSLYKMAEFLQGLGVKTAYNLDGGGSSTMVFNGKVINQPTSGGSQIQERKVSDIVYIG